METTSIYNFTSAVVSHYQSKAPNLFR